MNQHLVTRSQNVFVSPVARRVLDNTTQHAVYCFWINLYSYLAPKIINKYNIGTDRIPLNIFVHCLTIASSSLLYRDMIYGKQKVRNWILQNTRQ